MAQLKYLSNFCRNFEMPSINCEIILRWKWSANYFFVTGAVANQVPTFGITDTKCYVPVVTLLTQDKMKLLKQLESGFKRTKNLNNYQSKITNQIQNQYLNHLVNSSFQGINRLFVLSLLFCITYTFCIVFWNKNGRTSHSNYIFQK